MQTKTMRRIFAAIMIIAMAAACLVLTSCGKHSDNNPYKYAFLKLPDGSWVEGSCDGYTYLSLDLVRVDILGRSYKTHPVNVVLCEEKPA